MSAESCAPWDDAEWRRAILRLRANMPPRYDGEDVPVQVRRSRMADGDYGDAEYRKGRFYVRVRRDIEIHHALLVLTHEWAHCTSWFAICDPEEYVHDPTFGIAWARAYRVVFPGNA